MTKPLYFYNGTTFELVGPTTPQSPIAYQTSAPTAPATGDLWIDSDGDVDTYNRQLTRYYFVATAAQTTITGTDANGLTLAYVAGSEAVYVNGALQVRGQDYTATNGTSVVMTAALAVNDVVEIFAYTAFTVANAYTKAQSDSLRIGNVIKVVNATYSTSTSTTSTSYITTGLTASITPSSTSNKILILAQVPTKKTSNNVYSGAETALFRGTVSGTNLVTNQLYADSPAIGTITYAYLDSPSTTSSQTYTIGLKTGSNLTTVETCPFSALASIVLLEVAV